MNDIFGSTQAWQRFGEDPVLFYSACAALILALVSLGTGLARGDLLVLARPRVALRVLVAVAIGFVLEAAALRLATVAPSWLATAADGLAAVPVLALALAYGPSVGLLAGLIFAAAVAPAPFPGPREALLALELTILGWLAIYPSPRTTRWAGPLDALVAGALTWATAGTAWLAFTGQPIRLDVIMDTSEALSVGHLVALVALLALGPAAYERLFPGSRIAPHEQAPARPDAPAPPDRRGAERQAGWDVLATAEWSPPPRRRTELVSPELTPDDPNA